MGEIFQDLKEIINPQIEEAQWSPSIRNMKKTTPKNVKIKLFSTSDKEKILRESETKDTVCTKRQRYKIPWIWGQKQCKYEGSGAKMSFKNEGRIKTLRRQVES